MIYSNKVTVGVGEIARLTFIDEVNDNDEVVAQIAMHFECLKNMHLIIGQIIDMHQESVKNQAETNKRLS